MEKKKIAQDKSSSYCSRLVSDLLNLVKSNLTTGTGIDQGESEQSVVGKALAINTSRLKMRLKANSKDRGAVRLSLKV